MKLKLLLCLALVLSGACYSVRANDAAIDTSTNFATVKIASPQSINSSEFFGSAIFREQSTCFSLQVPVGFRQNGKSMETNSPVVQVWLLRTDGTTIPQSDESSLVTIGSIGNYSTDYIYYRFSKVPVNELAGVVININGKLYCQELKKTTKP
jgi:hypothetical protein